jgi:hypothetical protein
MPIYRERLWPAPWVFIATALVIPASLLVFLPISTIAGIICAIVLYGAIVASAEAFEGAAATAERGTRLDGRAWLLLRGWIPGVVRVELDDPSDPTPYWLVSSRQPRKLAATLGTATAPGSAKN